MASPLAGGIQRMGPLDSPPRRNSPMKKPASSPSWNLGRENRTVNLEVNDVNTVFQINKRLESTVDDIVATKEVDNVVSETAIRLKQQAQKVKEFQDKTKMRAKAARLKQRESEKKKEEERVIAKNKAKEVAAKVRRPNSAPSVPAPATRTLRPPKSAMGTRPTKANPKFKGKGPLIASSTDSNPWDYTPPKEKPQGPRMSAEESIKKEAQAATEAENAAQKARDLAKSRVKVAMAKSKEAKAKREAAEAVKKPVRKVNRPLSAPKTVFSTTAKDQYRDRLNKRLEEERARENMAAEAMVVDPIMAPAFDALKALGTGAGRTLRTLKQPPPVTMRVCEGICALVGEEPGWVIMQKLLARNDFLPTLAMCTAERIPTARLKKFRSQHLPDFPSVAEAAGAGELVRALCMWALAIERTADREGQGEGQAQAQAQKQDTVHLSTSGTVAALAAAVADLRATEAEAPESDALPQEQKVKVAAEPEPEPEAEPEPEPEPVADADGKTSTSCAPALEEAFASLRLITKRDRLELCRAKEAPAPVQVVMAGVCVLVGEDPGWLMSCRLLARPDFVPTLACCGPDRVPLGRIKKFRAQLLPAFPSLTFLHGVSKVGYAMCMWALAINDAFPVIEKPPAPVSASSLSKARGDRGERNPLKEKPRRVPTPQKAKEIAMMLEKTAQTMPEGTIDKSEPWQDLVKGFVGSTSEEQD